MSVIQEQPQKMGLFLPPLIQLVISALGLMVSILIAIFIFVSGGLIVITEGFSSEELLPFFSMAWSALFIAALLIPSIVTSIRLLTGKNTSQIHHNRLFVAALVGILLWGPLVLAGNWIAGQGWLPWLFLPPLQLLGVALPIIFFIELGRRKLTQLKNGSGWGVFSLSVILTQPVVLLIEIVLLIFIGVLVLVWIALHPDLLETFTRLSQRIADSQMDQQFLNNILLPYLQQPGVLYLGLAIGAGFIPLLEELLKPLALWVLVGRKFSEKEGFVLGLIAGGTFALLESLGLLASATPLDWGAVLLARFGTCILHVTTTALVGWGLGAAWNNRKYLHLGIIFLISFLLHATWNLFGLLMGVSPYLSNNSFLTRLNTIGPLALIVLAVIMILIIIGGNRLLQKQQALQPEEFPVDAGG